MPRNLELKVPFVLTDDRRSALTRLGARNAASLQQTDTYFHCRQGRLKLREITERLPSGEIRQAAELIAYKRPNDTGVRGSDYVLTPVPDPADMHATLSEALGIASVVRKRRELLLWQNVRIHLDEVEGLGSFLEFEAVLDMASPDLGAQEARSHERLQTLCNELDIDPAEAIAGSYADMTVEVPRRGDC